MSDPVKVEPKFFTALIIEFGGMGNAAKALGVSYQCVHNWRTRGVPLAKAKAIEELSEGRIKRKDFMGDL